MDDQTTSGLDVHLDLSALLAASSRTSPQEGGDRRRPRVRASLEEALRDAIRVQRLPAGLRLPSSRSLAADLGLARRTVSDVYEQLGAEGYLEARHGAGTWVASTWAAPSPASLAAEEPGSRVLLDLRPGSPDVSLFPRGAWLAQLRRAVEGAGPDVLNYSDPRGRRELRIELAGYLARARGCQVDPRRIVVCAGYRQAIRLLGAALVAQGASTMAVERPTEQTDRATWTRSGLDLVDLDVDEQGARTDLLLEDGPCSGVDAVVLTPAHQFPTGWLLAPSRRRAVLRWAQERDALVVEDDYDGEFRYDRQAVGTLQGLAPEHVAYAGSTSKTLVPGLRLGWLVLPERWLEPVVEEKRAADRQSAAFDQLALAGLLASGGFDRHVRRARSAYRRRREQLVAALADCSTTLAEHGHQPLAVRGIAAGLQAVVELPEGLPARRVIEQARRSGLALQDFDRFEPRSPVNALVVGYAAPPPHAYRRALQALTEAVHAVSRASA